MNRDDVISVAAVSELPHDKAVLAPVPLLNDTGEETTVGDLIDAVFDAGGLLLAEVGAPAGEGSPEGGAEGRESLLADTPLPVTNAIAKIQLELGLESPELVVRALLVEAAMRTVRARGGGRTVAFELREAGAAYERLYGE